MTFTEIYRWLMQESPKTPEMAFEEAQELTRLLSPARPKLIVPGRGKVKMLLRRATTYPRPDDRCVWLQLRPGQADYELVQRAGPSILRVHLAHSEIPAGNPRNPASYIRIQGVETVADWLDKPVRPTLSEKRLRY